MRAFLGVSRRFSWGYFPKQTLGGLQWHSRTPKSAKAKSNAYCMIDGGGLYLFLAPAGGKLWRWKYRSEEREKLITFGSYPDVPLSLARERHAARASCLRPAQTQWPNGMPRSGGRGFLSERCPRVAGTLAGREASAPCRLCEAPHGSRYSALPGRAACCCHRSPGTGGND